ncbi:hypothetical protein Goari_022344 [Gossypium aridum]|uniref:Reverse transcriptase zinc-binding domain-containing protein n=1 Tax=Gossypium aridum TaxID=34290 RepID=A0A7J8YPV1_GOSAI|nr:hypothetical protein [Gossypium aridum]
MGWRVGRGIGISVWDDHWIPGKDTDGWNHRNNSEVKLVFDLIDATNNMWKTDLVKSTFPADIAQRILQIPLAENPGDNFQLPSKIIIIVWRASWNYMPTLANLRSKRVADGTVCPRCRSGEEDVSYVFRFCPAAMEIWQMLDLSWVNNSMIQSFWDWLTWIFKRSTYKQC